MDLKTIRPEKLRLWDSIVPIVGRPQQYEKAPFAVNQGGALSSPPTKSKSRFSYTAH